MSNINDFVSKNKTFKGKEGIIPSDITGVTGDRVNAEGRLRYNNTTNLMEYYNGNDWKSIDSPPIITTVALSTDGGSSFGTAAAQVVVAIDDSANVIVRINGSLFDTTGATVLFEATSGTNVTPASIARNSANQIDATFNAADLNASHDPYTVKVTNGSGLSATLSDAILADRKPAFTNSADTTFTVYDTQRSTYSADCGATDPDGDTVTHSVTSGTLPAGASINSGTGAVTGADAVGTNTTSTFTVTAATSGANNTRQFNIAVQAPTVSTYTSSGTFTAVAGTTISYIVVAGGGSGGRCTSDQDTGKGGGGAGGMCVGTFTFPSSSPTPELSIPLTIGAGGSQAAHGPGAYGNQGSNSVFTLPSVTVTAYGGGGGGASDNVPGNNNGRPGGSGGGGGGRPSPGTGGSANQNSGTGYTGYGNSGGNGKPGTGNASGGGGGGAGASGQQGQGNPGQGGNGGSGRQSDITGTATYYAGGGGGGNNQQSQGGTRSSGGDGGGGRGNHGHQNNYASQYPGVNATANTGGGGGGAMDGQGQNQTSGIGGAGGSGVIIVKY